MEQFTSLIDLVSPYIYLLIPVCLVGIHYSQKRLRGIQSAKWLVEHQYDPAPQELFDEFIEYAESCGRKDRVLQLLTKARLQLGANNLKVGHALWLGLVGVEEDTPIDEIEIPTFVKEKTSKEK